MNIDVFKTFLRLRPNLKEEKISGEVKITVDLMNSSDTIILNAKAIEILEIKVHQNSENILKTYELNTEKDELLLTLIHEINSVAEIEISFTSLINKDFNAFYKANVQENGDCLLVTHCAYGETRRAFPCFDNPTSKSIFELELIINNNLQAVFNTDIKSEQQFDETNKLITFHPTPKMPPDILFLGMGNLDFLEKTIEGKKFRFVAEKPKATNNGSFALESLAEAFKVSQDYFQYPYPMSKLDLFALDRSYDGAMENWGAISILEHISLVFDITTNERKDLSQMIISHEVSHQWFGDLVSPTNFKKYIWLNESFATYFGYKILNEIYSTKPIWERFLKDQYIDAQLRDSFLCTVPIELPGDSIQAIDIVSTPIIYNKGASIIRQLDNFVGYETFRDGIRTYIEKYAYANATSEDLWTTLESTSQLPIKDFMISWVNQAGHPWIKATISHNTINLTQEKFSFIVQNNSQKWLIPITCKIYTKNSTKSITVLVDDFTKDIVLEKALNTTDDFYFINENAYGFYHVLYDQDNLKMILKNKDRLSATQKFILVTDYFAFFMANKTSLQDYFNIILTFKEDLSYLLVITILKHLRGLKIHLNNKFFEKVGEEGRKYLKAISSKIDLTNTEKDSNEIMEIRGLMVDLMYDYGLKDVTEIFLANYNKIIKNEQIHPSLIQSSLNIGAKHLAEINTLIEKYIQENREEMKMRYLVAISAIAYDETNTVFEFCLTKLNDRHFPFLISALARNNTYNKVLFEFLEENMELISSKNYFDQERIYYSILVNSKVDLSKVKELVASIRDKRKEYEKVLQLAEEECTVYHKFYELNSLSKS